jgi:HTH-type transcriptional regulator / antitoxin HigA
MMAKADSPEGEKLDVLTTLIEAYEAKHYPIDMPDPIEAIKFEMEQQELSINDLMPMIGRKNRVYEVLTHKRKLSLNMIRNLNQGLGIPAEVLIQAFAGVHA